MRWNPPDDTKAMQWHKWFAWHPVRIDNTGQRVWFETIQRRQRWQSEDSWPIFVITKVMCLIHYEYRELDDNG